MRDSDHGVGNGERAGGVERAGGGRAGGGGDRTEDSAARARLRWAVALLVAVAIGVASVVSAPGGVGAAGPLGAGVDKWFHAAGYAALALALAAALDGRRPRRTTALAAILAVTYGAAIELVQGPLATRTCDPLDLAANAVGAVVAALGWWVVGRRS
ncbi:VanZ family protein [Halomicrococcus gelatinilyticus]|uniref:VanZ family protein n=1 Tax=Halomicrococcus gelatinilyticus TaxID=1702103 RepID=UPI002E15A10A